LDGYHSSWLHVGDLVNRPARKHNFQKAIETKPLHDEASPSAQGSEKNGFNFYSFTMVENAITASNRFHGTITASPGHGDTLTASPASRTPHSQPFAAEIRRLLRHSRWHELRTTIYL
jgi:hypothetical protein